MTVSSQSYDDRYLVMFTKEEAQTIFTEYLELKHGASKVKFKNVNGKDRIQWEAGKNNRKNGFFIENADPTTRFCNAVAVLFLNGAGATKVNVLRAADEVGGGWSELNKERFVAMSADKEALAVAKRELTPEELLAIDKEKAEMEYLNDRADILSRLPGTAMAQYMIKSAMSFKDRSIHLGQKVKTPNDHPYPKKKGIICDPVIDNFYIVPNKLPTDQMLLKYIESEKFDMPACADHFKITKNEIIDFIKTPKNDFNIKSYFSSQNLKDGIGILPSWDSKGVITSVQRILLEKDNDGVDKKFITSSVQEGSGFVFNYEKTLGNPDYQPKRMVFTEGWATGKTLHNAAKNDPDTMVIVSWTANQLGKSIAAFMKRYPNADSMIAADNDCKSFFLSPEKSDEIRLNVKNTGLLEAAKAYASMPEEQHRMGILIPLINHKKLNPHNLNSDFNDIELTAGADMAHKAIQDEILLLNERRNQGLNELDRVEKLYNMQAQFFSNKYDFNLTGMEVENGNVQTKTLSPEPVNEQTQKPAVDLDQTAQQNTDPVPAPVAVADATPAPAPVVAEQFAAAPVQSFDDDLSADFLAEICDSTSIQTDFDRKCEQAARLLNGRNPFTAEEISTAVEVAPVVAPEAAPVVTPENDNAFKQLPTGTQHQAIFDPVDMTALLYHSSTIMKFSELTISAENREDLVKNIDSGEYLNPAIKFVDAVLDETIGKHLSQAIDTNAAQFKDEPFYAELMEIKQFIGPDFIQHTAENLNEMKSIQQSISNLYISENYDKGFDDDLTAKIFNDDVSNKPIDAKRELYKEIVTNLKTLDSHNSEWVHEVNVALKESYSMATSFIPPNTTPTKYIDQEPTIQ